MALLFPFSWLVMSSQKLIPSHPLLIVGLHCALHLLNHDGRNRMLLTYPHSMAVLAGCIEIKAPGVRASINTFASSLLLRTSVIHG